MMMKLERLRHVHTILVVLKVTLLDETMSFAIVGCSEFDGDERAK